MKALFKSRESAVIVLEEVLSIFGGCGQTENDKLWAISDCNGFETVMIGAEEDTDEYGYPMKSGKWFVEVHSNVVPFKAMEIEDFIAGFTHYFTKN